MNIDDLMQDVIYPDLEAHGITWDFSEEVNMTYPKDSECVCGGFFDYRNKIIGVACGSYNWPETMVHEYCHFLQYKEGYVNELGDYKWYKWVRTGIDYKDRQKDFIYTRNFELDCENRAVKLMRKYDLRDDINIKHFIQKENYYLLCYNYMNWYKRQWFSLMNYQNFHRVIKLMPTRLFTIKELNRIPNKYLDLLHKYRTKRNDNVS